MMLYKNARYIALTPFLAHHHKLTHLLDLGIFAISTSFPSACLQIIFSFVCSSSVAVFLVLVCCVSIVFRNKLRHLWWPNLCQTILTQQLLSKPFSKRGRRHAVLVYSFIFQSPCKYLYKTPCYKEIYRKVPVTGHQFDSRQSALKQQKQKTAERLLLSLHTTLR